MRKPQCIQGETVLQHKTTVHKANPTYTSRHPHTLTLYLSLTHIHYTHTALINWICMSFFCFYDLNLQDIFKLQNDPRLYCAFKVQLFFKYKSKPSRIRNKCDYSWPRWSIFHCNAAKLDLLKEHFHYYTLGHVWHKKLERKLFSPQKKSVLVTA